MHLITKIKQIRKKHNTHIKKTHTHNKQTKKNQKQMFWLILKFDCCTSPSELKSKPPCMILFDVYGFHQLDNLYDDTGISYLGCTLRQLLTQLFIEPFVHTPVIT